MSRMRVFDWKKAEEVLRDRNPSRAEAGLLGDWGRTAGAIWVDGEPVFDDYTYLASRWAIPTLRFSNECIECWVWEDETSWNAQTKWPQIDRSKRVEES